MSQLEYFDTLYHDSSDPWQYQTRWYEKRKRAILLAVLPQPHYVSAIELGCGNGFFSQELALRCEALLCLDGNTQAVKLAQQRLHPFTHVNVQQATIPQALPSKQFDLIVIGEILYYLNLSEIQAVIGWVEKSLKPNGTLLCCHWRYAIAGFEQTGETVHQQLHGVFNQPDSDFFEQVRLIDTDFLLGVWQKGDKHARRQSVAAVEGLI